MAKKHILQHEYQHGFKAIGITSAQKDYRMCWLLNNHLGFDMKRIQDFCITPPGGDAEQCFSVYQHDEPSLFLHVNLLANKNQESLLLVQFKNIDYLLLFKQPGDQIRLNDLVKSIRGIPQVQAAFLLSGLSDKKTTMFFFDFEMFLSQ